MTKQKLTVIILTYNEEIHIARCLESVASIASKVVVVDSGSTDSTRAIALKLGAAVYTNKWRNYSEQFNWALDNTGPHTEWILRLDADEIVSKELAKTLEAVLNGEVAERGFTITRRIYFLGKWIRWGGIYPARMLRLWRSGFGRCESRWMDEHILVDGLVGHIAGDLYDKNLNNIGWWTAKHNSYASREALDLLLSEHGVDHELDRGFNKQAKAKRWLKIGVYSRLPLGWRSMAYFVFRYFVLLGFLDGSRGFAFHFLQGFWYRFLVDAKICEVRLRMTRDRISFEEAVAVSLDIKL
ncbi:MAG: glycosyltransferase family 2 protein [Mesorhizobium sp.]|nr:MAG: glycosyltransferase family 2 protein [Mesorhizobium sp.]